MSIREGQEIELKNALVAYIRKNFVLEGKKELVNQKVLELACGLYDLFVLFLNTYPQNNSGQVVAEKK